MQIANGTTDKENPDNPACRKLAGAGAVRIRFPADPAREEPEHYSWCILREANWSAEAVLGWRFAACELEKRASASVQARKRGRRPAAA